jgi:hypothetical protein
VIRRAVALAVLCCLLLGCAPFDALLAPPKLKVPEVVTVENRSGPPILLRINATDFMKLGCGDETTFGAAVEGLPPLPWNIDVVRLSDDQVLWTDTIDQLPRWILVSRDGVVSGSTLPAGPPGPPCGT